MLSDNLKENLNKLIEINLDAKLGYADAAAVVSDADLQRVFNASSIQRETFANRLQSFVNIKGEEPTDSGSLEATLHRTWMTFKGDITSNNESTVIDECLRGEESAAETYEEALKDISISQPIKVSLEKQYAEIKSSIGQLKEWQTMMKNRTITS